MLIVLTGYSQTERTVIGNDTLYLIRAQNLRNANAMIVERDLFKKEIVSLYDQKRGLSEMVKAYSKEVVLKDSITANYRGMLDMNNQLITIAQKNSQALEKKIKSLDFYSQASFFHQNPKLLLLP